jgi:hypothetical protein
MLNFISELRPTRSKSLCHPENAGLEDRVHRHGRVIKRAIEIAAAYFQDERP